MSTAAYIAGYVRTPFTFARKGALAGVRPDGRAKRLLGSAETTPLEAQLALERGALIECVATADFAEGLKAFVGRRRPTFVGA